MACNQGNTHFHFIRIPEINSGIDGFSKTISLMQQRSEKISKENKDQKLKLEIPIHFHCWVHHRIKQWLVNSIVSSLTWYLMTLYNTFFFK